MPENTPGEMRFPGLSKLCGYGGIFAWGIFVLILFFGPTGSRLFCAAHLKSVNVPAYLSICLPLITILLLMVLLVNTLPLYLSKSSIHTLQSLFKDIDGLDYKTLS